jgi:drug/metabolite transporter (DMT)-like permease
MTPPRKVPLRVVLGLVAAVALDTILQVFWKTAAVKLPGEAEASMSVLAILREPLFLLVICIMIVQLINWMAVLAHADLSFAQPFTALSYISVGAISAVFMNEPIDAQQVLGIACVLVGVYFISQTDHVTQRETTEAPPRERQEKAVETEMAIRVAGKEDAPFA